VGVLPIADRLVPRPAVALAGHVGDAHAPSLPLSFGGKSVADLEYCRRICLPSDRQPNKREVLRPGPWCPPRRGASPVLTRRPDPSGTWLRPSLGCLILLVQFPGLGMELDTISAFLYRLPGSRPRCNHVPCARRLALVLHEGRNGVRASIHPRDVPH